MTSLAVALVATGAALTVGYLVANYFGEGISMLGDLVRTVWSAIYIIPMIAVMLFWGTKGIVIGFFGIAFFFAISLTNYRRLRERDIRAAIRPDIEFK